MGVATPCKLANVINKGFFFPTDSELLNTYWHTATLMVQSCLALCDPMDCNLPEASSKRVSRQESCSGLPFLPPGDLLNQGSILDLLRLLHQQMGSLPLDILLTKIIPWKMFICMKFKSQTVILPYINYMSTCYLHIIYM